MENAPQKHGRSRLIAILASALILAGIFFLWSREHAVAPAQALLAADGRVFRLEVSETAEKRALGLGERDTLCPDCGMLFLFETPGEYSFWMKGMRFPLDIIWLSGDRIVHIERSIPADSGKTYFPGAEADRVIELNAGQAAGLDIGESVGLHLP